MEPPIDAFDASLFFFFRDQPQNRVAPHSLCGCASTRTCLCPVRIRAGTARAFHSFAELRSSLRASVCSVVVYTRWKAALDQLSAPMTRILRARARPRHTARSLPGWFAAGALGVALLALALPSAADKCCERQFQGGGGGNDGWTNCVAENYNIFAQCSTGTACKERLQSGGSSVLS